MKKLLLVIAVISMMATATMVRAEGLEFGAAIGAGYPTELESVTFDAAATMNFGINKFFGIGLEGDFDWSKKETKIGEASPITGIKLTEKESSSIYTYPVFFNAILTIPMGEGDDAAVSPFIKIGAGYAWSVYDTDAAKAQYFQGLAWQAFAGALINLGEGSNGMKLVVEAGYRGTDVKKDIAGKSYELPMDTVVGRVGVVFALGGE